jgi:Na+/proline symporter
MSPVDWAVLIVTLAFFVGYGVWKSQGERGLDDFLIAGRTMPWPMVALSVMATQASAITFLSTPGQGFADGLRFVQFYFGLPLAMIVLCVTAIPIFHRLRVFTAYQYLEDRFDGKTRSLAAGLFLVQRGLAVGLTIYAPSLILSVILNWDVRYTCMLLGALAVAYTAWGGSRAVSHTHALQFTIILATMAVAAMVLWNALPRGLTPVDAATAAGAFGRLNALELSFDPNDRYNLWSGLIGGFFLQLSYFGTDQSQVGRYLTGSSVAQSRLGLLFNGLVKVPMQLVILGVGVLMFVFYLFVTPPLFFNPAGRAAATGGAHAVEWRMLEERHELVAAERRESLIELIEARRAGDPARQEVARQALREDQAVLDETRREATALITRSEPGAPTNDTNYVFLSFVLAHLPIGLIGLVFAAIFAASMNSTAAELNALTSTTVVDVVQRVRPEARQKEGGTLGMSRLITLGWAVFAVVFAQYASRLGSLIEAVNILGSLFYGTILGIFLTAFYARRVGGSAVFVGAIVAQAVVVACFALTEISFLWYNLIACLLVVGIGLALSYAWPGGRARRPATATTAAGA